MPATDTLPCGCDKGAHPGPRRFYVTVVREGQLKDSWRALLGPFDTHEEALSWVDPARRLAVDLDPKSHWYGFGTASTSPVEAPLRTLFEIDATTGKVTPR